MCVFVCVCVCVCVYTVYVIKFLSCVERRILSYNFHCHNGINQFRVNYRLSIARCPHTYNIKCIRQKAFELVVRTSERMVTEIKSKLN
jgi:hypothetical protein